MSKRPLTLFESTAKKPKRTPSVAETIGSDEIAYHSVLRRLSAPQIAHVLHIIGFDFFECGVFACLSKAWYLAFFHADCDIWRELTQLTLGFKMKKVVDPDSEEVTYRRVNFAAKYRFTVPYIKRKYKGERTPNALGYYLNQYGLMYCEHCGMNSQSAGKDNIPIAAFEERVETTRKGKTRVSYLCINPACRHPFKQKMCGYRLSLVFAACLHSSRTDPKTHNFTDLESELLLPLAEGAKKQRPLDRVFKYCSRCGLLTASEDDVDLDEEIACEECLEKTCVCDPCELCALLPIECQCLECDECGLCSARECTVCKRKCTCERCDGCDLPAKDCECDSDEELEF